MFLSFYFLNIVVWFSFYFVNIRFRCEWMFSFYIWNKRILFHLPLSCLISMWSLLLFFKNVIFMITQNHLCNAWISAAYAYRSWPFLPDAKSLFLWKIPLFFSLQYKPPHGLRQSHTCAKENPTRIILYLRYKGKIRHYSVPLI